MHTQFWTKRDSCAVSVYYPADEKAKDEQKRKWIDYRFIELDEFLKYYLLARTWFGFNDNYAKSKLLKYKSIDSPVFSAPEESKKTPSEQLLIPIIFSHDISLCRYFYTFTCAELASHGYIVFAIDHHDGSCTFTTDSSGKKRFVFDS